MPLLVHKDSFLVPMTREVRADISDVLMMAAGFYPPGYNLEARTRHERRRNKALRRAWHPHWAWAGSSVAPSLTWSEDALQE